MSYDTEVLHYLWDYAGISDEMHFEMHQVTANEAFRFRQAKMILKKVFKWQSLEYKLTNIRFVQGNALNLLHNWKYWMDGGQEGEQIFLNL